MPDGTEGRTAAQIMTTEVVTIGPNATVAEAADVFHARGHHALPVVDADGVLVGMLTDEDLVATEAKVHVPTMINLGAFGEFPWPGSMDKLKQELEAISAATVAQLMDTEFASVGRDASIEDVATMMRDADVSHVPVVENHELVGIIARADLIRHIAETT